MANSSIRPSSPFQLTATILGGLFLQLALVFGATVPDELETTVFAGPDIVPSPACLCAAPTGEVFVGVDLNGSLGKGPGKGRLVRLVDTDSDGQADAHTVFAEIDNPRGLISVGSDLFVLHTVIPRDTGILTGLHLSVLHDENQDGVADGPPRRLVSDLSVPKHNQDRGADHTTNGIAMGIDGWIYIAVGDFGFVGAKGSDGTTLTMLGGGIVRVQPDGSEMEVYTHGTRNIYDVAIDPFMNIHTRGNTNDGGGWNIRFIHHIQSGEYGYPTLFKNFTGEILPALADLGGGSGTGALFFAEPGWPSRYSNVPMMCDWGRSQLIIHRLTPDGASFTQEPEDFIRSSQIADVDVDGSGRLYLAAWDGAGYKGSLEKGQVERVVPKRWNYQPFPRLPSLGEEALVNLLLTPSAVARQHAQHELVRRKADPSRVLTLASNASLSLETRVAALFTSRRLGAGNAPFLELLSDDDLREFALRILADRKTKLGDIATAPFEEALQDPDPRVQVAAAIGLGRLGDPKAAPHLLAVGNPPEGTYRPSEPNRREETSPVYTSKKLKPFQSTQIHVDVTDWKELHLIVTDGSDGIGHDHAGWFDPTLHMADGSKMKLTDLPWKSAKGGWGQTLVDRDCTDQPLKRADEVASQFGIGTHATSHIIYDLPEGTRNFTAIGAATPGAHNERGLIEFVVDSKPPVKRKSNEGPHATPNAPLILPHVAIKSLVDLLAADACLAALDTSQRPAALRALQSMHDPKVVDHLVSRLETETETNRRSELIALLARLYQKEAPYDGTWWWGTRPDTRGPYYKLARWEKSETIAYLLKKEFAEGDDEARQQLQFWNAKLRLGFEEMADEDSTESKRETKVDLAGIASKAGEVGKTSIEDVILSLDQLKGRKKNGEKLFTQQGCMACHTLTSDETLKGPYMGQVGAILSREQIAESILKPNASISQGFATVLATTKSGGAHAGFITAETADEIEMRDIAGQVTKLKKTELKDRKELETSMMPPGLANALSLQEFADLVDFLAIRKN
ncbi:MAG: NPCBM/NEW2 domain-containing protein [Verrucomicrobiota bacterium]